MYKVSQWFIPKRLPQSYRIPQSSFPCLAELLVHPLDPDCKLDVTLGRPGDDVLLSVLADLNTKGSDEIGRRGKLSLHVKLACLDILIKPYPILRAPYYVRQLFTFNQRLKLA